MMSNMLLIKINVVALLAIFSCPSFGGEKPLNDGETNWELFLESYHALKDVLLPDEILVPADIITRAELGDHFETINPDRPNKHSAYGNPDSRVFHTPRGRESDTDVPATFGDPNGGGRQLMITERSMKLSQAIYKCVHEGLDKKVDAQLTEAQSAELGQAIRQLSSDAFEDRQRASKTILGIGSACIEKLESELKSNKDAEVCTRIRSVLPKLKLREALARFRAENPEPSKDSKKK